MTRSSFACTLDFGTIYIPITHKAYFSTVCFSDSASENAVLSPDLSNTIDSDSDHAGPSVTRLSHFSRNYRRRIIDESSSDDEEPINRSMERASSLRRPAEAVDVNYCFRSMCCITG